MPTELLTPSADTPARRRRKVYYPDGDGKPMAESDAHIAHIINLREILRYWLRGDAMSSVHANMLFYYKEGFPKRRIAPDVFVVWGVPKKYRRSYKLWVEERAPQVVFEITSRKTQDEDLGTKRAIYARIGVEEYYLFDPYGHYLNPPLRGYHLVDEEYVLRPVETIAPPSFDGKRAAGGLLLGWRLVSKWLKLEIWALPTGEVDMPYTMRFYDSAAGEWLPDPEQAMIERKQFEKQLAEARVREQREILARQAAEAQTAIETHARQAAEAEVARLKAELEKLRGKA
jgi:Uma2 family endonuclease